MPPAVIDALETFRTELERHDLSQAQRMARAWLDVTRQLHGEMELLAREIADRQAAGLPVTRWHIARMDRYQTLAGQLREQARRFVAVASDDVTEAQRLLAEWGVSQSADLITAQMGGVSIVGQFDRIPVAAVEGMIGNTGAGTPLGTLLRTIPGEASEGMTRALVRGIALGWHPTRTAQAMREGAAIGYERALLISRTEQMRVYRAASEAQYRASGVVRGYRRVASKSIRTCMACLMLDGTFYPLSEPFYDHPAGRCVAIPELDNAPRLQWTNGEAWFRAQDEATQRAMMGPGRFDAWRAGQFDLPDLVTIREDPVWGKSPQVTPLRRLLGNAGGGAARVVAPVAQAVARTVNVPEFRDAASAVEWGVANGVAREIVLARGVDLDGLRDVYAGILEVRERFGGSPLRYVGDIKHAPGRITNKRILAGYVDQLDSIVFGAKVTKRAELIKDAEISRQTLAKTAPVEKLKELARKKYEAIRELAESLTERRWMVAETPKEVIYHEMGHRLNWAGNLPSAVKDAINRDGYQHVVSEYARANQSELFAEMFASYMKGETDRLHPDFMEWLRGFEK